MWSISQCLETKNRYLKIPLSRQLIADFTMSKLYDLESDPELQMTILLSNRKRIKIVWIWTIVVSIGHLTAFYVVFDQWSIFRVNLPIPLTSSFRFELSKKVPLFSFEILQNHRYALGTLQIYRQFSICSRVNFDE